MCGDFYQQGVCSPTLKTQGLFCFSSWEAETMEAGAEAWSTVQNGNFQFIPCFHRAPPSSLTGAVLEQFLQCPDGAGVEEVEG